ncbi:camphor resistance protein CrcB [Tritonibacter multivorans]|uniref:Fluoride-specific ion channel FluC n=1 Tax=Tritonibacter multivorans TaxID=928856 RepID=A0A0P1G7C9_9RHOB|nr:fluoride efflux transporter CrcB [Tritonibacter multivorans]MDA7421215.1 fluoride efflux transporter CrcB [Tritonibacter multivorans]CUH77491.1 camphor resistance protein CrcB [Tritonibacter multivorans]SFD32911.1 CrcB protein [Tritonibacter multivorans]
MFMSVLQVALGGAIGASLRYLAGVGVLRALGAGPFPVAVLGCNILGSFLMGVFVVVAAQRGLTHLSPFVMTGILGGFTTFSAFSLETMTLMERGDIAPALLYVALSVGLSVGGLALGLMAARGVLL